MWYSCLSSKPSWRVMVEIGEVGGGSPLLSFLLSLSPSLLSLYEGIMSQ